MSDRKKIKALQATVEALKEQLTLEKIEKLDMQLKLENITHSMTRSKIDIKEKISVSSLSQQTKVLKSSEVKPPPFKGSESEDWIMWLKGYK